MKQIKIFNYAWHIAHQYELFKIPGTKFTWLNQYKRKYSNFPRGEMLFKFGVDLVNHYEEGKYDVALLHLDQQCFEENLWDRGKGSLYKEINSVIKDIPKIVIMHGTPYYPEMFNNDIKNDTFAKNGISSELIKRFKEAVKGNYIITNSKTAHKQWDVDNWGKGRTIWHGLDPEEWRDFPKEPRVVTMISPGGLDKYYDRVFLSAVKELLSERGIYHCHITVDAVFKAFEEYRDFLGRSLIYFNPTRESPMPRSRTEAMFSGACVITTASQDADEFIKDKENGFLLHKRQPKLVADLIEGLLEDYKTAQTIGQAGKKTALELFGQES